MHRRNFLNALLLPLAPAPLLSCSRAGEPARSPSGAELGASGAAGEPIEVPPVTTVPLSGNYLLG